MRWRAGQRSANLEDRRGEGGRGGGLGRRGAPLGLGGLLVLFVLSVVFKQDFFSLLDASGGGMAGGDAGSSAPRAADPEEEAKVDFVSFVLDDAQNTWEKLLPPLGVTYHDAKLVVFGNDVRTSCGLAQAASGPFYCPADQKVYLDVSFFDELHRRFGAPGDFARAYVIAHEIAHHVQHELGIEQKVRQMQQSNPRQANEYSVRLELQADCLAGVWANSTARRNLLEDGDFEEAMGAASAVGDDRIQSQMTGRVNPDTFTHGTSEQRRHWFGQGFKSGDPDSCDTFAG
jgi:uncharacterized protein